MASGLVVFRLQDILVFFIRVGVDDSTENPRLHDLFRQVPKVRAPFLSQVGIRADDCDKKVFIPQGLKGINQPIIFFGVIPVSGPAMLNPRNSPACLHSLVSSKMDVMHIIEVKLCITSENIREVTA